jgi:glycosyltransferase involved in cell wall biosynthesis
MTERQDAIHPRRVVIIQWYIPRYRIAFYEELRCALADVGIELSLGYGRPAGDQAQRGDAVDMPWATPLASRNYRLGHRTIEKRRLGTICCDADLVVVEQALKNLESYPLLAKAAFRGPRVAMWGHGRTYTKRQARALESLKQRLTRRADWFFAYTEGGAQHLGRCGYPVERVTVVQNASDTRSLHAARDRVTADDVAAFRRLHNINGTKIGVFVGGLDESKRLQFLLDAGHTVSAEVPGFQLIVVGDGPQRPLVEAAARDTSWVRYLGPLFGDQRAALGLVGDVLLMPGRVGLAVLDGFALGLPVVTTEWRFHAPEFEYMEHGRNGWIAADDEEAYAASVINLLGDQELLGSLQRQASADADRYSIEAMVQRFVQGIQSAMDVPRRKHRWVRHIRIKAAQAEANSR